MKLRPQSQVGWLMLQWVAVTVLGHHEIERRARLAAEVKTEFEMYLPPGHELDVAVVDELERQGYAVQHTQPPPPEA